MGGDTFVQKMLLNERSGWQKGTRRELLNYEGWKGTIGCSIE